jgi:hypothetical protein
MAAESTTRMHSFWKAMSLLDLVALAIVILCAALWGARQASSQAPRSGFLTFLAIFALVYLVVRGSVWNISSGVCVTG